jgi:hypothetical protein
VLKRHGTKLIQTDCMQLLEVKSTDFITVNIPHIAV